MRGMWLFLVVAFVGVEGDEKAARQQCNCSKASIRLYKAATMVFFLAMGLRYSQISTRSEEFVRCFEADHPLFLMIHLHLIDLVQLCPKFSGCWDCAFLPATVRLTEHRFHHCIGKRHLCTLYYMVQFTIVVCVMKHPVCVTGMLLNLLPEPTRKLG